MGCLSRECRFTGGWIMRAWRNASWERRLRHAAQIAACAAFGLTAGATIARSGTLSEVPSFGSNPGKLKMFKYVPTRLQEPAPLVVVLHGCNQSAQWRGALNQADDRYDKGSGQHRPEPSFCDGPLGRGRHDGCHAGNLP